LRKDKGKTPTSTKIAQPTPSATKLTPPSYTLVMNVKVEVRRLAIVRCYWWWRFLECFGTW